jgi:hypothetical protein
MRDAGVRRTPSAFELLGHRYLRAEAARQTYDWQPLRKHRGKSRSAIPPQALPTPLTDLLILFRKKFAKQPHAKYIFWRKSATMINPSNAGFGVASNPS